MLKRPQSDSSASRFAMVKTRKSHLHIGFCLSIAQVEVDVWYLMEGKGKVDDDNGNCLSTLGPILALTFPPPASRCSRSVRDRPSLNLLKKNLPNLPSPLKTFCHIGVS